MWAVQQQELGGPEVLLQTTVPRPQPGVSEILVRVKAAGVNPTDWKHRAHRRFLGDPPYVLGWDVSGVVEEVGLGVTIHKPGDEVFGMLPYPHGSGAYAELVVGTARAFVRKPAELDHVHAAALPLASLTALQALVDTAQVSAGDRVLIHAAAGGVGHLAVQIAKSRGAYVIGTASAEKHDFVRGLGADKMIDYRSEDFTQQAQNIDIVIDTIGGDYQLRSLRVLRPGGVLVSLLPVPATGLYEQANNLGVRVELMLVEADQAGIRAISELATSGQLRPTISQVFAFDEIAAAHRAGETGRTAGKLVISAD